MNPAARLSVSLLVGLVLWLPALEPCLRGDIGMPEAGIRYLVAFGFVSVALAGLDRLIRAYAGGTGEDGGAMAADGTEADHLLRRDGDGTIPRRAFPVIPPLAGPVILVVEDHADIRDLLRLQLELDDYTVLEASSGERALELLRSERIDLVLLDAELPGMSGYDVLEALRFELPALDVPVLFLSGRTSTDDIVEAFRLGAHDHVAKPFRGAELKARMTAALQVKRRHDDLRRANVMLDSVSRTDVLTGLANRRKLEDDLQSLASSARRHDQPFSVALVDIDHFKRINDTYGHSAGDTALRIVAQRLQSSLRVEDVLGRWGGEEFLLLLPLTELDGAVVVGERLRTSVAGEPVALSDGVVVVVQISVGIASGTDIADLLERADAALYRAKAGGRNLVTA